MKQIFETDWLASQPVFYNELTGKVSHNINDVIDFNNFEFHPEGFNNYLDFGYSILEQTPIKHVKFLRHSSRLIVHDDGKLEIEYLDDPVTKWIGKTTDEKEVFHLLYKSVRDWEKSVKGEIVIPTSGGYDSRLLNLLIEDKSRIRSFTYGISNTQAESFEVVYAKKISEILGTKWEHIPIGDFHLYFEEWDKLFGISTHAHGMYHIEFYQKIMPKVSGGNPFLSGIIGDLWSGGVPYQKNIVQPSDLYKIAYTHGMHSSSEASFLKSSKNNLLEKHYESHKEKLNEREFQLVSIARMKNILLSYLISVPQRFGFKTYAPFLEPHIVLSMLTLPTHRTKNRLWQKEFFQKQGLDLESMNLRSIRRNSLNYQAMKRIPLKPLDVQLLREVIKPDYLEWINYHVGQQGLCEKLLLKIHQTPKLGGVLRRLNLKEKRLQAYCAYLTLKPIENLIQRRFDARLL